MMIVRYSLPLSFFGYNSIFGKLYFINFGLIQYFSLINVMVV